MKILVINAKPTLVDALAATSGVEVIAVWPERHHFTHLPPPRRVPMRFYRGGHKLNLRACWQLRKLIQVERPDVAHAFYGRALAHLSLAVTGLRPRPRVVSFRGISTLLSKTDVGDWVSYRHPCVDAHACESDAVRDAMVRSGIDAARCATVYNTVYSTIDKRPGRPALAQFGIPADAFVVSTVGTLRRLKRVDLLLEAAIACTELRDAYWLLMGKVVDPRVKELAAHPSIRDRVRLVGHRADAAELVSGADLFVMPSRDEALCQALLEAMHQGVCPIVSDAGGMKEVVRHGVDGLVVPAENAAALAGAIRSLYANHEQRLRMAASAKQRIADMFTAERMAERLLYVYGQMPSNTRRLAA